MEAKRNSFRMLIRFCASCFLLFFSSIGAFPANGSFAEKFDVPRSQKSADIEWVRVISRQDGRYVGWPTICRRSGGELLVVFSGDRDFHICPFGKLRMVRSRDDGITWSAPETIANSPLDDRDGGIIELPDGKLLAAWFTSIYYKVHMSNKGVSEDSRQKWRKVLDNISDDEIEEYLGHWTMVSADGGRKWSRPSRTVGSAPHGPICLSDGRLLYVGKAADRRTDGGGENIVVEESLDGGKTWRVISKIEIERGAKLVDYHEPHAVEAADGSIIAQIRCHSDGFLRQSVSRDGGRSWSVAEKTPLFGYPSHLIRLKDNSILSVYGRRKGKMGEFGCFSYDNGKTWDVDGEVALAYSDNPDIGYPSSAEMPDGSIITVYYQHDPDPKLSNSTCLMATKWRPKKKL